MSRTPLTASPALARRVTVAVASAVYLVVGGAATAADGLVLGVSWSNFQEERWRTDEAAMRAALREAGGRYLGADAQSSSEKQLADIESLIARGAQVLVVLAQDAHAILPAVGMARAEGIPVIAYDRRIAHRDAFYLSFDNKAVGRLQARALLAVQPQGRFVYIKGSAQDPNADFVHAGQAEVLAPAIAARQVQIVGEQYVDGWLPERARNVMDQMLTANGNDIDAVVCSNDGMAGGVVAALRAQGLEGIPVSGQDGDHAALNRVARGLQTVSVWKDSRTLGQEAVRVARALASGTSPRDIGGARAFREKGRERFAILLEPVAVTRANLDVVLEAGWIERSALCRGVDQAAAPAACR